MIPFGPYYLLQRLAVGGMAEVFIAIRKEGPDDDLLVVKRILPHLQDKSDFLHMFLDEARLSSQLSHPNLVKVHDFGKAEGLYFIVMEYIDGMALSGVLRRRYRDLLPLSVSCWLIAEACAGLAYAHGLTDESGASLGIIHRDISPDNILISRTGEVKLADFGVAKASLQVTRTRPGQIKGKLAYMSPEQGMRLKIDSRSDIFSIGVVLYELTTGQRVFPAPNEIDILRALYQREYVPPEKLIEDFPPSLAAVVNRALQWNPDDRFQRATEMRDTLLGFVSSKADPGAELSAVVEQLCEQRPSLDLRRPERDTQKVVVPPLPCGTIPGIGSGQGRLAAKASVSGEGLTQDLSARPHDTIREMNPMGQISVIVDDTEPMPVSPDSGAVTNLWMPPSAPEAAPSAPEAVVPESDDIESISMTYRVGREKRAARGFPWGWIIVGIMTAGAVILGLILELR